MDKLLVSPAPHLHSKENTRRIMRDVIIALMPSVLVSVYFAGLSALLVVVVSVAGCVLVEHLIVRYLMRKKTTVHDLSAVVTGLILAVNLPVSSPWWMVLIGCIAAIGIAKMTFGGLGHNLFNPALVGRVFLLISFPVQMTNWSVNNSIFSSETWNLPKMLLGAQGQLPDAVSGATPLGIIKEGLANGLTMETLSQQYDFSYWQMLFGHIDGSLGEASALAVLVGFAYLLFRKVIKPLIPVSILFTVAVFSAILWLLDPSMNADPLFHLLTGGLLLGAVFMATDYTTSPMSPPGMLIYGVGIGVMTMIIRVWGVYPEGVSFAILFMNALTPLLNKIKPIPYKKEVSRG
ncbi:MAG TPA: RnfABCDGE type electron transport complex subunit D [Bacteroidales bacterium]|nr:RnfABCDGE type electron transport complex subunit D [Bacteroidales bacterium]HOQ95973.1 RnfABCDGE type electron transport complex subunit D [Bacteroidales bacterium]HPL84279.1 RnfABCDGE type electron transport complex subunit D [Bacteroidales bacterium]